MSPPAVSLLLLAVSTGRVLCGLAGHGFTDLLGSSFGLGGFAEDALTFGTVECLQSIGRLRRRFTGGPQADVAQEAADQFFPAIGIVQEAVGIEVLFEDGK